MKFTRVFALTLAILMIALSFASCGEAKQKLNVTVQIYSAGPKEATEDNLIINMPFVYETTNPTVLGAVEYCLIENEIAYTLSTDGTMLASVQDISEVSDSETAIMSYWSYQLNGVAPGDKDGRASVRVVAEGDVITYYYVTEDFSK